jgi:cell wall assembly regulator SMI1
MLSIDDCWMFLESCLGTDVSQLPAAANSKAISQAEATMGVSLPGDFRRFLSRHDGSGPCFISPYKIGGGPQRFLALHEIALLCQGMTEIGADFEMQGEFGTQTGPVKRNYWNSRWIPFTDNGCGDNIFIDLDPSEGCTIGQIVDWWHEGGVSTFQAASLQEWLNEVVDKVRKGVYQFRRS